MSEFKPIFSRDELLLLDDKELVDGYRAGLSNEPEPENDKSRSFHHGWKNGMVDGGHRKIDVDQQQLACSVVNSWSKLN